MQVKREWEICKNEYPKFDYEDHLKSEDQIKVEKEQHTKFKLKSKFCHKTM